MVEGLRELPLDPLVYELGGLLLFFALLGFAHTSHRLLALTGHGWLWLLPLAGAVLMLAVVGLHFYANIWYPAEHAGDADLMLARYRFRFIALLALLGSSSFTVAGAVVVWTTFTGLRIKG